MRTGRHKRQRHGEKQKDIVQRNGSGAASDQRQKAERQGKAGQPQRQDDQSSPKAELGTGKDVLLPPSASGQKAQQQIKAQHDKG